MSQGSGRRLAVIGVRRRSHIGDVMTSRAPARNVVIELAASSAACVNIGCVPSKTLLACRARHAA